MTYTEIQPPVIVTRDEVRQIALCASAVLDGDQREADLSPQARKILHDQIVRAAKDVLSWCDGTLLSGENDAFDPPRMVPITFRISGYYAKHLAERLDLTPQPVLDASRVEVLFLKQLAGFIDGELYGEPAYSIEARLEALGDYERLLAKLQRRTDEYVAELSHDGTESFDSVSDNEWSNH